MGRSVQNLVEIGTAGRAWKGDIGTNSHFLLNPWTLGYPKLQNPNGEQTVCKVKCPDVYPYTV